MSGDEFRLLPGHLGGDARNRRLTAAVLKAASLAPFRKSVISFGQDDERGDDQHGPFGWVSDQAGYRYRALGRFR